MEIAYEILVQVHIPLFLPWFPIAVLLPVGLLTCAFPLPTASAFPIQILVLTFALFLKCYKKLLDSVSNMT